MLLEERDALKCYEEMIKEYNPKFQIDFDAGYHAYFGAYDYPSIYMDYIQMAMCLDAYLNGLKFKGGLK